MSIISPGGAFGIGGKPGYSGTGAKLLSPKAHQGFFFSWKIGQKEEKKNWVKKSKFIINSYMPGE
jgi:hypothetical protein